MSEKTKKRPELPEGAVGWAPVNSDGKVVGPVQEDPDAPKKREAARKEAAKAILSSRKKSADPEKDKQKAAKTEEDGEKKLLSEDPSKLSDEALSAAEKASHKALKDDKYGENGQKVVDAVKGEKQAREEKGKREQGEASAAHASDIADKAAVAKEEREAKAKESLGPDGEEVRANVEAQKALPGTAAARLLAKIKQGKVKDAAKKQVKKPVAPDAEKTEDHKKKLELSNGVTFTMDYSNVIELSKIAPAGQLAFRYKHGWILINPGIPSRGRMGGGLARKHGVKSGTTTKGHFEKNSNGKGAKFVATSTGHATISQQLKETKQKFEKQLFEKAQAKEDRALQRDVKKMKQHVAEETARKASKEAAQASLDALTTPPASQAKVDASLKAYELHSKAQTLNADAGLLTEAAKHSDAALIQQKNAHSTKVLVDKAEALKEKKAKEKAEEEAKAEKAKQELQAELGKKAKEKYKKASDIFAAASVAEDKAVKSKKVEDYEAAAAEFQKAANEFTKGGKLAESAGDSPGLYNGLAAGMKNKVKNLKDEAKKQAESDKVLAELFDNADGEVYEEKKQEGQKQLLDSLLADANKPSAKKTHVGDAIDALPEDVFDKHSMAEWKKYFETQYDAYEAIFDDSQNKADADKKAQAAVDANHEIWKKLDNDQIAELSNVTGDLLKVVQAGMKTKQPVAEPKKQDKYTDIAGVDNPYFVKTSGNKQADGTALKTLYDKFSDEESKTKGDTQLKAIVAMKAAFADNYGEKWTPSGDYDVSSPTPEKEYTSEDFMVELPGPGMYADGNALKALLKKIQDEPSGPKEEAMVAAYEMGKQAFKDKHGVDFKPGSVEDAPTPQKSFVPAAATWEAANKAGFKAVSTSESAHGDYKPTPALKSKKGAYVYSGGSYSTINAQLRKYKSATGGSMDKTIAKMDAEFAEIPPLKEGIVVGRKLSGNGPFDSAPPFMTAGAEYVDHGYSSTSKNPGTWSGDTVLEVRVPKGVSVLDLNHTTGSQHSSEQEILLNRGTKYRVISDTKPGYERRIVVEVVPA